MSQASQVQWEAPKQNCWKLNSDVAWNEKENCRGIKWVVHDSNGSLICVGSKKINRLWNIKTLEAKAILEGMKKISSTYIHLRISLEIETDALEVIRSSVVRRG